MNWFEMQLEKRISGDREKLISAFSELANAVLGTKDRAAFSSTEKTVPNRAISEVLSYFQYEMPKIPEDISGFDDCLEYALHPYGVRKNDVRLSKNWFKDAFGVMIGFRRDDGSAVALIPESFSGYRFFDENKGIYVKVSEKNQELFSDKAFVLYKPFPMKRLSLTELTLYILKMQPALDFIFLFLVCIGINLIHQFVARINHIFIDSVIVSGEMLLLLSFMIFFVSIIFAQDTMHLIKLTMNSRLSIRLSVTLRSALVARLLSMPVSFFKQYKSGELANYLNNLEQACVMFVRYVLAWSIAVLFSLLYIVVINSYAPSLVLPTVAIVAVSLAFAFVSIKKQLKLFKRIAESQAYEEGLSYELLSGIQKLKLAGAEKRAFNKWASAFAARVRLMYNLPAALKYSEAIITAIMSLGLILTYYIAVKSNVGTADFYAFTILYGYVTNAFISLPRMASYYATVNSALSVLSNMFATAPEISPGRHIVRKISGSIQLDSVSFRYMDKGKNVIDSLSLSIKSGEYLAIVGESGCGKSTLLRLILGFETPQKGAVYYDKNNLSDIDLEYLHKKIGVVLQDGKLIKGDIFANISITAPWITMDEAWQLAELAGIADDIRKMPLGMHTEISPDSPSISGGQRQRIMIARAIASKPSVLIFDEATSALDNITQKHVSSALESLGCTRIVVAHRLSTIMGCDRIVYIENGRIAEEGNYEQLISKNGKFAEMVKRQIIDSKQI